jgi:hypothetical protein
MNLIFLVIMAVIIWQAYRAPDPIDVTINDLKTRNMFKLQTEKPAP